MKVIYCNAGSGNVPLPKDHGIKDGVPRIGDNVVTAVPGGNLGYDVVKVTWNRSVRSVFVFLKQTR